VRPERALSERSSLAAVQSAVLSLVTGRAGGEVPPPDTLIVSDARANAYERMAVYAHMYRARIAEALESQFPRLAKLLGADAFSDLARAYINDVPSQHPSLRYIGERLPSWLAKARPDSPEVAALAALEWARADVFDLADDEVLTLDDVRDWPQDRFGELPLQLVTAHRLVTVRSGAARLWDSIGGDVADPANDASTAGATEGLLVWRDGTIVYHRPVVEAERAALELASRGTSFGVVCESLLATHGEEAAVGQAYAWMSTWLADGLLRP